MRVQAFDPSTVATVVDRYVDAGLTNLVFWAQDLCPAGADRAVAFMDAARRLGIGPD